MSIPSLVVRSTRWQAIARSCVRRHRVTRVALASSVAVVLGVGCAPLSTHYQPFEQGAVVILPPRSLVDDGTTRELASGVLLGDEVERHLRRDWGWDTARSGGGTAAHDRIPGRADAMAAGSATGAPYALVLALGTFGVASPPDHGAWVELDAAILYDARNGDVVWQLAHPARFEDATARAALELIPRIANEIAKDIVKSAD